MALRSSEIIVRGLFSLAGIEVNGSNPWDIQVHDPQFYDRVLRESTLGLGPAVQSGLLAAKAIVHGTDYVLDGIRTTSLIPSWLRKLVMR